MTRKIDEKIEVNRALLEELFAKSFDAVVRSAENINHQKVIMLFFDGLVDKEQIYQTVLAPFLGYGLTVDAKQIRDLQKIRERLLTSADISLTGDFDAAITHALSGDTVVFVDGAEQALVIQTRKWQHRGIPEAKTQKSIRGPKESFTETLLFNVAQLRRKIKSPALKTEIFQVGSITKTDVCLAYLEGIAEERLLKILRSRLENLDVNYILESGHMEQLLEDHHASIFSTTGNHEKPDIVAAKLLKGRACILVDGTPFALTMPMVMGENFSTPEDYYSRPFYANFLRILRFCAYLTTLLLPGMYTALVTFHREMIPDQLLSTLIVASEGAPLPIGGELFMMLILYELLREAILRLPEAVGTAVGIVGVLIIGEAAVGIRLIGAPSVVIAALTFITSSVVPPLADSNAILRLCFLGLGAFFGAYGVFAGLFALFVYLCGLSSYGCPFMLPLSPTKPAGLKDLVLRMDLREILRRTGY